MYFFQRSGYAIAKDVIPTIYFVEFPQHILVRKKNKKIHVTALRFLCLAYLEMYFEGNIFALTFILLIHFCHENVICFHICCIYSNALSTGFDHGNKN